MKAFQAYATNACNVTRPTAKEAALAFFEMNPKKRKCNVVEGEADGHFFTITYRISREGKRPQSWNDVTKSTAQDLPANCDPTHITAQSGLQPTNSQGEFHTEQTEGNEHEGKFLCA